MVKDEIMKEFGFEMYLNYLIFKNGVIDKEDYI